MTVMQQFASIVAGVMLAALPASGNFQLNSYGFGTGGTAGSSSSNYRINGTAGEVAGNASSTNYKAGAGEANIKQANVPTVALSNDADWYNKLRLVIGPENNPADAKFSVAISTDGFVTTQYVKADLTIGSSLTSADYQTYAAWGSAAGVMIRGLKPSTVYTARATATRGNFTESGLGPAGSATTSSPSLSFSINVSASNVDGTPPYVGSFGNLLPNTVTATAQPVWVNYGSNAESGGNVFIKGQNAGLRSAGTNYTIASSSGDIAALPEGFGLQVASSSRTSGSAFVATAPYDGSGNAIGAAGTGYSQLLNTTGPTYGGTGQLNLKAKAQAQTPASGDYTELLTLIAAASF